MARSRVYKNLTRGGKWSIKQKVDGKWTVVGHCDACVMIDVVPYVSEPSRARLYAKRAREVHAWLEGDLVEVSDFASFRGRDVVVTGEAPSCVVPDDCSERVTYHPFDLAHEGFHFVDSGAPVATIDCAWFNSASQVWCA